MGHADTASSFSVSAFVLCLFCFFSGFPYRIPRRPLECGAAGVETCRALREWQESGRVPRARAAGGPRHTSHVSTAKGRSRVSLSHHTRVHTAAYAVCFLAFPFLRARPHIPLSQFFFFFQTTDSDRDIRAERERERDGDTYIVNRVESSRACTCDMQDHVPLHQDASCAPVTLSGPSAS